MCHHHLSQCLARRQDRRTLLAHNPSPIRGNHRLHHRSHNDGNRSKIFIHDAHGPRRLHRLRRCPRLDLQHPSSSARETCRRLGCYQRRLEYILHLRILYVFCQSKPEIRSAPSLPQLFPLTLYVQGLMECTSNRHGRQLRNCRHRYPLRHTPEIHSGALEQEIRSWGGG